MAQWEQIQRDFSGGEVGHSVIMRDDAAFQAKSLWTMENFMPTLQGTAVRTPGAQFVLDVGEDNARIFPYIAPDNSHALLIMTPARGPTPGVATLYTNVTNVLDAGILPTDTLGAGEIMVNPRFSLGMTGWEPDPAEYTSHGESLGVRLSLDGRSAVMAARLWKYPEEAAVVTMTAESTLSEDSDWLSINVWAGYSADTDPANGDYTFFYKVGTTAGANDIWEREFTWEPGYSDNPPAELITGLGLTTGTTLYVSVELTAISTDPNNSPSAPFFNLREFSIQAAKTYTIGTVAVVGDVNYQIDQLKDLHYVQSPYQDSSAGVDGKEMVFTHPQHAPSEFLYTAGAYTLRPKVFVNVPPGWSAGVPNYPAVCTSFHGRLILAGGNNDLIGSGSSIGATNETVWGTEVGAWDTFTVDEVNPDDSIEFTTIYRSAIQWVFGQKDLLIGAVEMEYTASADGIFQPADLGVFMHSTHGSSNVQPVGIGDTVLFPAEAGTKVRSMNYSNDAEGWVAPDLTILHPELCASGIRRMVRLRNPQQMVAVLLNNGQIALLHRDTDLGITGWSRINMGTSNVTDLCVLVNDRGEDVLFVIVNQYVSGISARTNSIEAFSDWVENKEWAYLRSNVSYLLTTPASTIVGLDHLEGMRVEAVGDSQYLGAYIVTGGTIDLVDQLGTPIVVTRVIVGLSMISSIRTMPLITNDPGSKKRYSDITVRINESSRPMINGIRPDDRTPINPMGLSEPLDGVRDHEVSNQGWSKVEFILIQENLPLRCEVLGIFGKLTTNSV